MPSYYDTDRHKAAEAERAELYALLRAEGVEFRPLDRFHPADFELPTGVRWAAKCRAVSRLAYEDLVLDLTKVGAAEFIVWYDAAHTVFYWASIESLRDLQAVWVRGADWDRERAGQDQYQLRVPRDRMMSGNLAAWSNLLRFLGGQSRETGSIT